MIIKEIELRKFKRFKNFKARFSSGINVVKGLNEMGKSTLLGGIVASLFYNPKGKGEVNEFVSWFSDSRYQTRLNFLTEEGGHILEKDFEEGTVQLTNKKTNEKLGDYKRVMREVTELVGTASPKVFLSSTCIRQNEVSDISRGKKEIGDSLEGIVTGGEEDINASRILKRLENKANEVRKGLERPTKYPGVLRQIKGEIENNSERLKEIAREVDKVESARAELIKVEAQLKITEKDYKTSKTLLDNNKKRQEIETKIRERDKEFKNMQKFADDVVKFQKDLENVKSELKAFDSFGNKQKVEEVGAKLHDLQVEHGKVLKDKKKLQNTLDEAESSFRKSEGLKNSSGIILIVVAIVVGLISIIGTLLNLYALLGLIISSVAGAAGLYVKSGLSVKRSNIDSYQIRIAQMAEALNDYSKREKELLKSVNCATVEEFRDRESNFQSKLKKKEDLVNQLKGKLGDMSFEQIEQKKRDLAQLLAVENAKLTDDLKVTMLDPEKYVELETKFDELEKELEELRKKRIEYQTIVKETKFNIEDQISFEEKQERLEEALRRWEHNLSVYELAIEYISRARTEILESVTSLLEEGIQRHLRVITDGRYNHVKVNKENLDFRVYSDEKGEEVNPEECLSKGTIDQFYLAARLALAQLLFKGKKPPLILDDPFVTFDSVRLKRTLELCRKLAKEFQIILFTVGNVYDEVADKIIGLT